MRYHVKGGIWKNTEDEILKAAVMKYGLNQWSRISSLLVRKSAKQCKERWYEWLDPKIKKTEWTKVEEEMLLNLAKMFPCQWRTIAPYVGRTAYQCLEHYEHLLDKAQGRENDPNDPRKLRPGEIDPNPEAKPARPDPIDLDEDTKETLNEARARVANTRGKKAKRKIREKQLEEARRLAALQKKRELKSAGIDIVIRLPKKKKKELNYNTDVPFMRTVPKGTWSDVLEETPEPDTFKGGISLQYLENRNRDIEEEKQRKLDEKRMKNLKQKNLPKAIEMINRLNDPMNVISRTKLNLPSPQVNETDLKEIAKITSSSEQDNKFSSTSILTGDYSQAPLSTARTPNISYENKILTEAKIAYSLREGQTPLIGGENSKSDLDFYLNNRFKTPLPPNSAQTPGTVLTNLNNTDNSFRDEMEINKEKDLWENNSNIDYSSNLNLKTNIKQIFENIPKPNNKYTIEVDDKDKLENEEFEEKNKEENKMVIDMEDIKKEQMRQLEEENNKNEICSVVIKKKLPRINLTEEKINLFLNYDFGIKNKNLLIANELVKEEICKLIKKDNINYPFKGMNVIDDIDIDESDNQIGKEERELIEQLIQEEMVSIKEKKQKIKISSNNENKKDYKTLFSQRNALYEKELSLNAKLKQKNKILTHGYNKNLDNLMNEYKTLIQDVNDLKGQKKLYEKMLNEENSNYLHRKRKKEEELYELQKYESELQNKYTIKCK